jgi:hypothetical protein
MWILLDLPNDERQGNTGKPVMALPIMRA